MKAKVLGIEDRALGPSLPPDRDKCLTLAEIAVKLGVSRERVGFIERQALRKMRRLVAEGGFPNLVAFFEGGGP